MSNFSEIGNFQLLQVHISKTLIEAQRKLHQRAHMFPFSRNKGVLFQYLDRIIVMYNILCRKAPRQPHRENHLMALAWSMVMIDVSRSPMPKHVFVENKTFSISGPQGIFETENFATITNLGPAKLSELG